VFSAPLPCEGDNIRILQQYSLQRKYNNEFAPIGSDVNKNLLQGQGKEQGEHGY